MKSASQLLEILDRESCDLRCVNVPTGGDDYEIEWRVIEHSQAEPVERIIAYGVSPIDALNNAFKN